MEKRIVSNTSSLLFLAKLNRFDLLKNVYPLVLIPQEVIDEMRKKE